MPRQYPPRERRPATPAEATFPFAPPDVKQGKADEGTVPAATAWPLELRRYLTYELRRRAFEPYGDNTDQAWRQLLVSTYAGRQIERLGMRQVIPQAATPEDLYELALADAKDWDAKQKAG